MKFGSFALLLIVALSGCSSAGNYDESSRPSTTPTPTADTASIAQWAGLVAERKLELDDWYEDWDDAICSSAASTEIDCNVQLTIATFLAQTNHIVIAAPSDPAAKTYLGKVPAEISSLYAETISLTEEAQTAGDAWSEAGCESGEAGDCIGLAFEFESALDSVRTKFAAWSPYL